MCYINNVKNKGGKLRMKSNKGFTLVELLAVIVILAIIALIATPLIMNIINEAKEGAAKDSAYAYIK
ncbi:MAG: prepilin-type N-terminal cleavage/methylation domain-containing protein, partial [Bacilli bacterium]|nr:prepilin-type N-terminal cleavage/methylation domain-containing protein [Bacilli bacterium]